MAVFIPLIGDFIIAKVNTEEGNGVLNDTFQNVNNPCINHWKPIYNILC